MEKIKKVFKTIIVIICILILIPIFYVGIQGRGLQILLIVASSLVVLAAQLFIDTCYSKGSESASDLNMSGYQVARYILDSHGLTNVKIEKISGKLTDHYDSRRKVVRLSSHVYNTNSMAAIPVAAHECGHAIQDANKNILLRLRNFIAPCIKFITYIGYFVIVIGASGSIFKITMIGIIILLAVLLFQLITLPIEIDASKKALKELENLENLNGGNDIDGFKLMLTAAAFTYVAALLSTIFNILRLIAGQNKSR